MTIDSPQPPPWAQVLSKTLSLPAVLYSGGGHRGVIRRWKLVARSLIQWPWTLEWYRFLETPRLQVATAARLRLYTKLQRPYSTRRHGFAARLAALKTHYTWVEATLPEATGSGNRYEFIGSVDASGSQIVKVANASDTMMGVAYLGNDSAGASCFYTADASDTITLDGSTKGGLKGWGVVIDDIAANIFAVIVMSEASGTEATPFSATVS
jgi:hypothetical protein